MPEEIERTRELLEQAYDLAQKSRELRAQVKELAKKAAHIREASRRVRDDLGQNGKNRHVKLIGSIFPR